MFLNFMYIIIISEIVVVFLNLGNIFVIIVFWEIIRGFGKDIIF